MSNINIETALRGIALLLGVDPTGKSVEQFLTECASAPSLPVPPAGSITNAMLAGGITNAKLATGIDAGKLINPLPAISGAALTAVPAPAAASITNAMLAGNITGDKLKSDIAISTSATVVAAGGLGITTPTAGYVRGPFEGSDGVAGIGGSSSGGATFDEGLCTNVGGS